MNYCTIQRYKKMELEESEEKDEDEKSEELDRTPEQELHVLSLNSMVGINSKKTIKKKGRKDKI